MRRDGGIKQLNSTQKGCSLGVFSGSLLETDCLSQEVEKLIVVIPNTECTGRSDGQCIIDVRHKI